MQNSYFRFHQQLLTSLYNATNQQLPAEHRSEDDQTLVDTLQRLSTSSAISESFIEEGQWAICRLVAAYPVLTPHIGRDLFWLFGGECLHYMPDEEIERFQALDERRFAAEDDNTNIDYAKERMKIFGMH